MLFFITINANAFEVGDVNFKNTIRLSKVFNDSDNHQQQIEHIIVISKKKFPLWLYNRYTQQIDSDLPDKLQIKTTLGYKLGKTGVSLIAERHEYNYKKNNIDAIVYRAGIQFKF